MNLPQTENILKVIFTALIVIGGILIYGVLIQPNWIKIRGVQIKNHRLKRTIGHLRIVHLSDLHISTIGYREKKTITLVKDLDPDLILITGDLVAFKQGFGPVVDFLDKLQAKQGIWIALGNTDYSNENGLSILCHELNSKNLQDTGGIHFLRNSHETIVPSQTANQSINFIDQPKRNNCLTIIGLDDPVTHKDDLAAALDGVPQENAKILLTHYQNFTTNSDISKQFKSIDLVLSGHTHGGQIFILKHLPSFINHWYFKRKSDKENSRLIKADHGRVPSVFEGLYHQEQTIGYINRGLGVSYLPIRLGVRPEIAILEFTG